MNLMQDSEEKTISSIWENSALPSSIDVTLCMTGMSWRVMGNWGVRMRSWSRDTKSPVSGMTEISAWSRHGGFLLVDRYCDRVKTGSCSYWGKGVPLKKGTFGYEAQVALYDIGTAFLFALFSISLPIAVHIPDSLKMRLTLWIEARSLGDEAQTRTGMRQRNRSWRYHWLDELRREMNTPGAKNHTPGGYSS